MSQNLFYEFLDLTPSLTNQADHDDVGRGVTGHHAQQHTFAHPRARKKTQPLTSTDCEQSVDGTYAGVQGQAHRFTVHGIDGRTIQGRRSHIHQLSSAIHGHALGVDNPPQQTRPHGQGQAALRRWRPRRFRVGTPAGTCVENGCGSYRRTAAQTLNHTGGHQVSARAGESHHLGQQGRLSWRLHQALRTDRNTQTPPFQNQARCTGQCPTGLQRNRHVHACRGAV